MSKHPEILKLTDIKRTCSVVISPGSNFAISGANDCRTIVLTNHINKHMPKIFETTFL